MNGVIAVGITNTTASQRAVEWAIERAAALHHDLLLVSVVGAGSGVSGEGALVDEVVAATELMLDATVELAGSRGVRAEARIERGKPLARLIEVSQHAQLLVIGRNRFRHADGVHLGGQAIRMTAGAHCPVAVIPDRDLFGSTGVVVGVDGSDVSERAVRFAAAEADRHGDTLTAVTAWSPLPVPMGTGTYPPEYLANMQALTEEESSISLAGLRQDYPDLDVRVVVASGYPGELICREAEHARLAVVGSHGRGAIGRFLLGSTSEAVIEQMPTAVIIVR
ncbi:universal stress protein [Microbacterium sp. SLBN-146]|uniref:universal stress protein n=1 Tax=Microbacterium sp. SLBN-146 TaxID=2768457 RepID=UPI00114F07CC|nr:universal stress protein [Microbacterium sp. SLBN-146]TQJ31320.1 nucleotide-binding universal stress UspA family protein [Microbacterium sp. SLBN-146]